MPIQNCPNLGPAECAHAMNKPTNQQKNNKSANHNSTVPQTIVRKTLARRNARKRSAAPGLSGEQCVLNTACSSCQTPSSKFLELFAQFQVLQALLVLLTPQKSPRRPRAFRRASQNGCVFFILAAQVSPFSDFWLTFCRLQNSSNFDIVQKAPKTSKIEPQGAPSSILEPFGSHFGTHFLRCFDTFMKKAKNAPTL